MKSNKIIATSIASMMLVAGMAMPKAFAVDDKTAIRYAQNYIESNSYAIAVGLSNGDKDLTRAELNELVKKYNMSIMDSNTSTDSLVKSGDKVKLSTGTEATVVVYGDVEANGKIDLSDVQSVYDHYRGKVTLEDVSFKAGDVEAETSGNAAIDLNDIQRVYDYYRGSTSNMTDGLIVEKAKLPADNSTIDANFELVLNDTDGNPIQYINNQNKNSVQIQLNLERAISQNMQVQFHVYNETGEITATQFSNLTSYYLPLNPSTVKYKLSGTRLLNFYSLPDQTYTITVTNRTTDEVIATKSIQKVTNVIPEAVHIQTERSGGREAKLSFRAKVGSDITKVYYTIGEPLTDVKYANVKTVSGNTFNEIIANDLDPERAYNVHFIVENSYGNRSNDISGSDYTAVIANDLYTTKREKPAQAITYTSEKLIGSEVTLHVTPTFVSDPTRNTHYLYTLYDENGEIVKEEPNINLSTVDFKVTKGGKYKIGVIVRGKIDGTSIDSEEYMLPEYITVEQLAPVSNVQFVEDSPRISSRDGRLTWECVDSDDIDKFDIILVKYDGTTFVPDSLSIPITTGTSREVDLTGLAGNTLYKAKVTVKSKNSSKLTLDSEPTWTTQNFFILSSVIDNIDATSTTATLQVNKERLKNLGSEAHSYDVEIWTETPDTDTSTSHFEWRETRQNVIPASNSNEYRDYLVVEGLTPNTEYYFKLVLRAKNAVGKSDLEQKKTLKALPSLTNLTVVDKLNNEHKAGTGNVFYNNTTLYVGNEEITNVHDYDDPNNLLETLKNLVSNLQKDDQVSLETGKASVTIKGKSTDDGTGSALARNFGDLENISLEIMSSHEHRQKIVANVTNGNVTLKGEDSWFDISDVHVVNGNIIAENGVEIENENGDRDVTVKSSAVINDVTVEGSDVNLKVSGEGVGERNVTVSQKNEATNLTLTSEGNITVDFESDEANTPSKLAGVKVKATGNVTINSNVRVDGNIDLDVTNGDVEVIDPTIKGKINITVKYSNDPVEEHHVKVRAERLGIIPDGLGNATYDLSKIYEEKDPQLFGKENREAIEAFLKSFGISKYEGVKLQISRDNIATFTFTQNATHTFNF